MTAVGYVRLALLAALLTACGEPPQWEETGPGEIVFKRGTTTGPCTRVSVLAAYCGLQCRDGQIRCEQPGRTGEYNQRDVSTVVRPR